MNCVRELLYRMQEKLQTVGGNCCVGCKLSTVRGNCCVGCKSSTVEGNYCVGCKLSEGTAVSDVGYQLWEGTAGLDASYQLWEGTAVSDVGKKVVPDKWSPIREGPMPKAFRFPSCAGKSYIFVFLFSIRQERRVRNGVYTERQDDRNSGRVPSKKLR